MDKQGKVKRSFWCRIGSHRYRLSNLDCYKSIFGSYIYTKNYTCTRDNCNANFKITE